MFGRCPWLPVGAAMFALLWSGCCVEDADCTDTGGQFCVTGRCEAAICTYPDRDCSDGIDCTSDSCDEDADTCLNAPDDAVCDDELFCSGDETCDPSVGCVPGTPPDCDDSVDCTADACDEDADECVSVPDDGACDDSVDCTLDSCDAATGCGHDPDDALCDDGDVCTGTESCDPLAGCLAGTPLECDDGVFCNGEETCSATLGCQPGTPVVCDDAVDCTTDSCNETEDRCDFVPDDSACDDGSWCTGVEVCDPSAGCIPGTEPPCEDDDECTADLCDDALESCVHLPLSGTACDFEGGGADSGRCFDGVCLERGCGDGYVEPGPTPPAEECDPGPGGATAGCTASCLSVDFRLSGLTPAADDNGDQEMGEGSPAVAALADGRFVVAWTRDVGGSGGDSESDQLDVRARFFTITGHADGDFILLNPEPVGVQRDPAVAQLGDGFIAVWSDDHVAGGTEPVLWARPFDQDGLSVGRGRRVDTTALLSHPAPALAAIPTGGVLVVWEAVEVGGGASSVRFRWLDASGRPEGTADELVSSSDSRFERSPAVAISDDGTTALVVWVVDESFWLDPWIAGALLDVATGLPLSGPDLVLSVPPAGESDLSPTVVSLPAGGFFLVHRRTSPSDTVLVGRMVSTAGALGPAAELTPAETEWTYIAPAAAPREDGAVAIAWTDARAASADGSQGAVAGALVEPVGTGGTPERITDIETLSTTTAWDQQTPHLATSGSALATCFTDWSGEGGDTDGAQVRCRVLGGGWFVE